MAEVSWKFAGHDLLNAAKLRHTLSGRGFQSTEVLKQANCFVRNRGKSPSFGYVLLTKSQLETIPNRAQNKHNLVIKHGSREVTISNLCVVHSLSMLGFVTQTLPKPSARLPIL